MIKSASILALGMWLSVAGLAWGQQVEPAPTPTPSPEASPTPPRAASPTTTIAVEPEEGQASGESGAELAQASGEPSDVRPRVVRLANPPRDRLRASGDAGALEGLRILGVQDGQARVVLGNGSERILRAGELLGRDVVRSVSPGRILLDRRAAEGEAGGSATVVVKLDAGGQTRVYVYWTSNPRPKRVPKVSR